MSLQASHEVQNNENGTPPEGLECMSCCEEIDESNYVEYKAVQDACVEYLLKSQWKDYVKQLSATSCKAEQTRLLERGPPMNLKDNFALPCPDNGEVVSLWFAVDGKIKSAKLDGSLEGEERQTWWDDKLKFQFDEDEDESYMNLCTRSLMDGGLPPFVLGGTPKRIIISYSDGYKLTNRPPAAEHHTRRDSGESEQITVVPMKLRTTPKGCTSDRRVILS